VQDAGVIGLPIIAILKFHTPFVDTNDEKVKAIFIGIDYGKEVRVKQGRDIPISLQKFK
jgi:hypothetical protein